MTKILTVQTKSDPALSLMDDRSQLLLQFLLMLLLSLAKMLICPGDTGEKELEPVFFFNLAIGFNLQHSLFRCFLNTGYQNA